MEAAERLEKDGKKARVVSMVCWELFENQPQSYRVSGVGRGSVQPDLDLVRQLGCQQLQRLSQAVLPVHFVQS